MDPPTSPINIKRSDAHHHDISVFIKSQAIPNLDLNKSSKSSTPGNPSKASNMSSNDSLEHETISLKRSDGLHQSISHQCSVKIKSGDSSPVESVSVRIVHYSDTHNFLFAAETPVKSIILPVGDILVHSGDFTNHGTEEEFQQFDKWLKQISSLYKYRVIVLGRHDVRIFGSDWNRFKSLLPNATHVLCHEEATIMGLRFYGCPWNSKFKKSNTLRQEFMGKLSGSPNDSFRYSEIPINGLNVLVTHSPSYGRCDSLQNRSDNSCGGSKELLSAVLAAKPGVHCHGMVHEAYGILNATTTNSNTLVVNSCMTDINTTCLCHAPHVVQCTWVRNPSDTCGAGDWFTSIGALF